MLYRIFTCFFSIDWRKSGCVTGVKDEGPTDLSAVYTVTGVLEGQSCIPTGKLVALSNQNIIDCACRRGLSCSLEEISAGLTRLGGIESEASYPDDPSSDKCRFDPSKIAVRWNGYADIVSGNENALQQAVATIGLIGASIDASHSSFQLYTSGGRHFVLSLCENSSTHLVYNEPNCSQTQVDLNVLIVGYGNMSNSDYWLVRNW